MRLKIKEYLTGLSFIYPLYIHTFISQMCILQAHVLVLKIKYKNIVRMQNEGHRGNINIGEGKGVEGKTYLYVFF